MRVLLMEHSNVEASSKVLSLSQDALHLFTSMIHGIDMFFGT